MCIWIILSITEVSQKSSQGFSNIGKKDADFEDHTIFYGLNRGFTINAKNRGSISKNQQNRGWNLDLLNQVDTLLTDSAKENSFTQNKNPAAALASMLSKYDSNK